MITMTDGVTMLIDDADIHLLAGHKPYLGSNGYAYVSFWDGQRSNQRNQANRANGNRNNTSGHRGVVRYEGPRGTRWHARIMANGKSRHLGTFATAAEAVAARRAAEREYFGEECPR